MAALRGQVDMFGNLATGNEDYEAFVKKFEPKKTTDDCYTPENVYEAVAEWVNREYGVDRSAMVRPFWPGADYERAEYPDGCCVVDNPPFSILVKILRFYISRRIRYFLFAPTLTLFTGRGLDVCYVPCGAKITYANGANINTSFITNLDDARLRTCPDLYRTLYEANRINEQAQTKQLPKYSYPDHVLTAASAYQYSHYGIDFRVERNECRFIASLDAMRAAGKNSGIFGGALLLSDRAAAERAAAERAAAERAAAERAAAERAAAERAAAERAAATVWELSVRERAIVRQLNDQRQRDDHEFTTLSN